MSGGGASGGGQGADPIVHQIAFLLSLLAIVLAWPLVRQAIPLDARFAMRDLLLEHWQHREQLEPWLGQRWLWLADHRYHLFFALAALPGALAVGMVQAVDRRARWPLFSAPVGWAGGGLVGLWLYGDFLTATPTLAVMLPALFAYLGGAVGARLGAWPRRFTHLRGTRMRGPINRVRSRLITGVSWRVALAGVPLTIEDETMHIAAIGATGSGKSTALRALIADARRRGDRQVVADPDGSALSVFYEPGDVILNPFDARCARWDLLSEIEHVGDFAMLAQSLLPHLGHGDHDQWISYAQQLLSSAMESWVTNEMGSSAEFVTALAQANKAQLKTLCEGTPAARFFEEGGERMLASILGTITPALANLRSFATREGDGFSIRQWVRGGTASLWMPYTANQIAALRGLISCWMNLAIVETLSLPPSRERRIWFHVDELDALGRIEGLRDAQARLRKFGGRVAIGFQSFAQVKQIYGEGAHTIIENCGNLLLLRSGLSEGGGTAELASDLIGNREVERDDVSRSRTRGRFTSRSTSMQSKRVVEDVTLASEIMQLPNREGFVKRATAPEWWRVRFPFVAYRPRVSAFEPNDAVRIRR
jgi:energy-coupling factor transporter ATP-binding protein EcfA2